MKRIQVVNYVIENARYSEDAPANASYHVRFPNKYGSKILFAEDTDVLVEKLYKFANQTPEGRKLAERIGKDEYMSHKTDSFENEELEDDGE